MNHTLNDLVRAHKEEFGDIMPAPDKRKAVAPVGLGAEAVAELRQELLKVRASKILGERSLHESIQRSNTRR